jgi:hypothetical protein
VSFYPHDHYLSPFRDCVYTIFAATLYIWRPTPPSTTRGRAMPWSRGTSHILAYNYLNKVRVYLGPCRPEAWSKRSYFSPPRPPPPICTWVKSCWSIVSWYQGTRDLEVEHDVFFTLGPEVDIEFTEQEPRYRWIQCLVDRPWAFFIQWWEGDRFAPAGSY